MLRQIVTLLFFIILFGNEVSAAEKGSRQKRCIVIQKQSGGRADSGEGGDDEDYDYKRPQPKDPGLDRLQARIEDVTQKKGDVEAITPELLKYKPPPMMPMFRRLKLKDRLRNFFQ